MQQYLIRKQFKFESAHQLKCAYSTSCCGMHGHSYLVEVFFQSGQLDNTGMVIDFGQVSDLFKKHIDSDWDHNLIMPDTFSNDYLDMLKKYNKNLRIVNYNPTAENMARVLFNEFAHLMALNDINNKLLHKVRVHETATGWAEYKPLDTFVIGG